MLFENQAFDDHERVVFTSEQSTGLRAIIAIHSTKVGPAMGGVRFYPYANSEDALTDVLRLSQGMTLKNVMAGLPIGGGKSVIIGDPKTDKSPALLAAFGRAVNTLGGSYVCAEDVGTTTADMAQIHAATRHVAGLAKGSQASGDPSPLTARGVFFGIQAAVRHKLGLASLAGVRVAVLGLGNVGGRLCQMLNEAGAQLTVADIDPDKSARVSQHFGAQVLPVDNIICADVDVFAPCALGGVLNADTVRLLKAPIVAGAANNQLAEPSIGRALHKRRILYAPDFVINAGGIINAAGEMLGHHDAARVAQRVRGIADTLESVFAKADAENCATADIAVAMAQARLAAAPRLVA